MSQPNLIEKQLQLSQNKLNQFKCSGSTIKFDGFKIMGLMKRMKKFYQMFLKGV